MIIIIPIAKTQEDACRAFGSAAPGSQPHSRSLRDTGLEQPGCGPVTSVRVVGARLLQLKLICRRDKLEINFATSARSV